MFSTTWTDPLHELTVQFPKAIRQQRHRIPTTEDRASRLSDKRVFSVVEEKDGLAGMPR